MTDKVQGFCVMQPRQHHLVQLDLFAWSPVAKEKRHYSLDILEVKSWANLYKKCKRIAKQTMPQRVDEEEWDDYLQTIEDETGLEMAVQLREIADQLEKRINGK